MGHWTVFCAITHAPIRGGDRCVAIWTKPDKFYVGNEDEKGYTEYIITVPEGSVGNYIILK